MAISRSMSTLLPSLRIALVASSTTWGWTSRTDAAPIGKCLGCVRIPATPRPRNARASASSNRTKRRRNPGVLTLAMLSAATCCRRTAASMARLRMLSIRRKPRTPPIVRPLPGRTPCAVQRRREIPASCFTALASTRIDIFLPRRQRKLQNVTAQVAVAGQPLELAAHVLAVDHHFLPRHVGGLKRHVLQQPFHHGVQPPGADVLGFPVDFLGDGRDGVDAVVRKAQPHSLGGQQGRVDRKSVV